MYVGMSRATHAEHILRLNKAIQFLADRMSPGNAAAKLAGQCDLSVRQAYRYVQRAQASVQALPVPEAKAVFTVKLPQSLIREIRGRARRHKQSISGLVSHALRAYLQSSQGHG
jgi:hypothetical protein